MTVVSATLTFGASLTTLVSHPALYGWNFGYAFYSVQGYGRCPSGGPAAGPRPAVAATTGVYFVTVQIDGQTVPAMAAPTRPAMARTSCPATGSTAATSSCSARPPWLSCTSRSAAS